MLSTQIDSPEGASSSVVGFAYVLKYAAQIFHGNLLAQKRTFVALRAKRYCSRGNFLWKVPLVAFGGGLARCARIAGWVCLRGLLLLSTQTAPSGGRFGLQASAPASSRALARCGAGALLSTQLDSPEGASSYVVGLARSLSLALRARWGIRL